MNVYKRFGFSFLLFTGMVFSLTSCSYKEPTLVSFDGVEQANISEDHVNVTVKFTLENPNSSTIKLKSSVVDVSINNIFIGTATLLEPAELPRKGKHQVALKTHVKFEKSVSQMAKALGLDVLTNNLEMHVTGTAKGSMGLFKRKFDIDYTEKMDWRDLKKMVL